MRLQTAGGLDRCRARWSHGPVKGAHSLHRTRRAWGARRAPRASPPRVDSTPSPWTSLPFLKLYINGMKIYSESFHSVSRLSDASMLLSVYSVSLLYSLPS